MKTKGCARAVLTLALGAHFVQELVKQIAAILFSVMCLFACLFHFLFGCNRAEVILC